MSSGSACGLERCVGQQVLRVAITALVWSLPLWLEHRDVFQKAVRRSCLVTSNNLADFGRRELP